jgi:hypothetical protein
LRERFLANGKHICNGSPAKSHDFDEPQEWLAQLSNVSGGEFSQQYGSGSQQTPMMTPKKFTKVVVSDGGANSVDILDTDNGQEPVDQQRESSGPCVAKRNSACITSEKMQMGKFSVACDKVSEDNSLTSKHSPSFTLGTETPGSECSIESTTIASNSTSPSAVVDNVVVNNSTNEAELIVHHSGVASTTHTSHRQCKHLSKHGSGRHSCHSNKISNKKLHHSRSGRSYASNR